MKIIRFTSKKVTMIRNKSKKFSTETQKSPRVSLNLKAQPLWFTN
jgi:hypothetical protein